MWWTAFRDAKTHVFHRDFHEREASPYAGNSDKGALAILAVILVPIVLAATVAALI